MTNLWSLKVLIKDFLSVLKNFWVYYSIAKRRMTHSEWEIWMKFRGNEAVIESWFPAEEI